ncbi:MAG: hypothetical protein H7247_05395 [Polaromonas sp.]|nr:hypothetical protein [Gemmatimonadaceae bacterium]
MKPSFVAVALLAPMVLCAQSVTVRAGTGRRSAEFIPEAGAQPHRVIAGSSRLELPRDSTVTTTLIVIGRPTYLASKVRGNVIVIGADLFLRPGVEITGHAVAIGGTVATTTLGRVDGRIESFRDDAYDVTAQQGGYILDYRETRVATSVPLVQPAGIMGLMVPSYDRVDGLSLPVGLLIRPPAGNIELEPFVTYRSRLGVLDPAVNLRVNEGGPVRFSGRAGQFTRSNETWNYSDLVNSATTFFVGIDTRNYFRSKGGEGRIFGLVTRPGLRLEPFVGGRYEQVRPITAGGNVYSVKGRTSVEKIARPNPLVEVGSIGSGLLGAELNDTTGVVASRVRAELERSFTTITGTANFTQLTLDGRVGFPTFGTQSLHFRAHGVATSGNGTTRARYAYLGGSGTLPVLEQLELGGDELLFLESQYQIPLDRVLLPLVGSPIFTVRHIMGSAGIGTLPSLEQEIGARIGLSVLRLDYTLDVAKSRGHKISLGISLTK